MGHIKGEKACKSQVGDKLVIDKLSISINHIFFGFTRVINPPGM